jgi:hypothetical protein
MRSLTLLCGLGLAALAGTASAQDILLYSNGTPPPQLTTGPTTDSGVASPAGTTWSEVQHPTGDLTLSNTSAGATETQGAFRIADDFTVPAGPGWVVNFVELHAYQTGAPATPSPFTQGTVQIWGPCTVGTVPGAAGCTTIAFGDTTTNRFVSSTDATLFRTFNTVAPPPGTAPTTTRKVWRQRLSLGVTLAPGYYWVDWATTTFNAGAHFAPSITVPGVRGLPGWNARQFNVTTAAWVGILDTGNPAAAPDVPQDQTFELYGVIAPVELQSFEIK